jgi:asparagine synthase (glutamine-hydrolysing)
MCGIAGVVFGAPLEDPIGLGRALTGALRHRGPDAQGWAELPGRRGLLAHTRLSIIDLSDRGRQPMWTPDGAVALAFNGEIYDFQPLRAGLEARGVRFRSDSDTEVILQQYLVHGADGLDALDGMFALALYDARSDRLLLMRDRTGKKPLYWTRTASGALAFASEAKALAPIPGVTLSPEPAHLAEYLTFGYVGTPRSAFQGVHRLPPAHRMVCAAGGPPALTRYWQLPPPRATRRHISVPEALAEVRATVGAAVARRMVADVPLGAFLSGGVDSSVIVAEMARRSPRPVRTFCVGFEDDETFDERGPAREVAERFGADHTELVVRTSPTELLEQLLWHHDEPYGDSSALAVYAVSKATRAHVTVVLTGDGGDEVFAGYTRFAGGLAAERVPEAVSRGLHEILGRLPSPRGYKNPLALAQRFVAHAGRSKDEQLLAYNTYFAGPALQAILRPEVAGPGFDPWAVMGPQLSVLAEARAGGADRLDQLLRHNLATYLLDDLLVKTDRMTMAVALEARSPFLDTALMASAFTLPSALKLRGRTLKWLLKEAYRGVLPDGILDRKKHGFGVPVGTWWNGEARAMVDDLLVADGARSAAYLDPVAVRRLVAEHRSGRRDHGQRIFALLQLELWLRRT